MTSSQADGPRAGPDLAGSAAFADAAGAIRTLLRVAVVQFAGLAALLVTTWLTQRRPGVSPALDALLHEGAAGLLGAALLISLTATLACLLLAWGRQHTLHRHREGRLPMVTRVAGWPQAMLILAGMGLAALVLAWFPPLPPGHAAAVELH